jgi:DNA-binding response OmpR family regulator
LDFATPSRRILLVEPNVALRSAIVDVLAAEAYDVQPCASLEQALKHADGQSEAVALVAWQSMNGLLAEEHRHNLAALTRRLRLVLMVPRHWARMLDSADLGVAALVAKPFDADELLATVRRAMLHSVAAESPAGGVV